MRALSGGDSHALIRCLVCGSVVEAEVKMKEERPLVALREIFDCRVAACTPFVWSCLAHVATMLN